MPDRLVVGDVRGAEAMSLVSALCSSVDGATVAMTGEGGNAALTRLATLARLTAAGGADGVVRELVAASVELVIHVVRGPDGTVRINTIEEVVGYNEQTFDTQLLFHQKDAGFAATGTVPRFYTELAARGIAADQAVFR